MWYTKDVAMLEKECKTSVENGLSQESAAKRLEQNGANKLPEAKVTPIWLIFLKNFTEPLVLILLVAALISLAAHEMNEAIVIVFIVIINALIGTFQEAKARASLSALQKLTVPTSNVVRNGETITVNSADLVVGDLVLLEAGQFIPADLRIVESAQLMIDESALTGESVPVEKAATVLSHKEIALAEQVNMAFTSTFITNGRAKGIIVATGKDTEIGKIATMLGDVKESKTPLQIQLGVLSKQIAYVAFAVGLFAIGLLLLRGTHMLDALISGITLSVAVIPESLPVIVSIVLALSVSRMAKQHAIVKQLPAVETLGSVSVICSDKTGTLTKNEMTITKVITGMQEKELASVVESSDHANQLIVQAMALCNDSGYTIEGTPIGDPTELALTNYVNNYGSDVVALRTQYPRVDELPFDSDRKLMTVANKIDHEVRIFTKGAADQLIARCTHLYIEGKVVEMTDEYRKQVQIFVENYSKKALRVLGYATKVAEENETSETYESNLTFIGMSGMIDPEREEVKDAIEVAKNAGIRTVMITGDHKVTAFAIGRNLGMVSEFDQVRSGEELNAMSDDQLEKEIGNISVFARVSPEHKVRIVKALQASGLVVSMTGDGVNDAPSLRTADVGVAMGITGTDVSKEAANMILTDDNFTTIVGAVSEGRNIYAKIKKAITFILSTNLAEVLAIMVAIVLVGKQPLAAVHVLWINLIVESLLAIPMGGGKNNPKLMEEKPRPKKEPITSKMYARVLAIAAVTFTTVVGTYFYFLQTGQENIAQTMTFIVMANAPVIYALSIAAGREFFVVDIANKKNMQLYGAVIIGLVLNVVVVLSPASELFKIENISLLQYITMLAVSAIPFVLFELKKIFNRRD